MRYLKIFGLAVIVAIMAIVPVSFHYAITLADGGDVIPNPADREKESGLILADGGDYIPNPADYGEPIILADGGDVIPNPADTTPPAV